MFSRRTTLVIILIAPLSLCLTCLNTTNTREWYLSVVCLDKSVRSPNKCQWDVVDEKTATRVEAPRTSPSSNKFFNCSTIFRLPSSPGRYIYRIEHAANTWTNAFHLRIDDPGEPTVKNCAHEVYKGDYVECLCSTEREGNPPPVISWPGQTTSPTLYLRDVRDSRTYTCEMIWGNQRQTASYSLIARSMIPAPLHVRTTSKPPTSSGKVTSLDEKSLVSRCPVPSAKYNDLTWVF